MTDVERGVLDEDKEDDERRWVVCEPVWEVVAAGITDRPERRELVPGVNEVAAWRAEREAARRLSVVKRQQSAAEYLGVGWFGCGAWFLAPQPNPFLVAVFVKGVVAWAAMVSVLGAIRCV